MNIPILGFVAIVGVLIYARKVYLRLQEKDSTVLLIVSFKEGTKIPDVQNNSSLKKVGKWETRGDRSFSVSSVISGQSLLDTLLKEFNLSEDQVSIYDPAGFYWGSYGARHIF